MYFIFVILCLGTSIYELKNLIQKREKQINILEKKISQNKDEIQTYKAEYAYLSSPGRIENIAIDLMQMKPVLPSDIWNIKDLGRKESKNE